MLMLLLTLLLAPQSDTPVERLNWLTGCWRFNAGPRTVTEYWLPPSGGMMMAMSRTVSHGKVVEYEFIVLRPGTKGLEYVAKPSGQAEAVFTSTSIGSREVVFENPSHDFPTRITYRRTGEGLLAAIGGTMNGQPRTIEFKYQPADCGK